MRIFSLLVLVFSFSISYSQLSAVKGKTSYEFWLNLPSDSVLKTRPPVLIFLHGKSLSGTDLNKVKRYGVIHEIEKGRKLDAIVVAPQVQSGSWSPDKILEVLEYIQKTYTTDTNRVYVCGMSLGGYGTLHFAGKYAQKITAAVALCGGGNPKEAATLSTIPLWIQHGTADEAVAVSQSRVVVAAIKNVNKGKRLIYDELKGVNHGALEKVFRDDKMYLWLFSHIRTNETTVELVKLEGQNSEWDKLPAEQKVESNEVKTETSGSVGN